MSKMLKIVAVGDGLGIELPSDVLDQLRAELGDSVRLEKTDKGFSISKEQPSFDEMMSVAREIMRKDWNILRALSR